MNALLNYFDEKNENHIGIKQFIEKIKEYSHMKSNYSLFDDEYKQIPIETLNEKILSILAEYITANKMTMADCFNNLDSNNNGSLSRAEMSNFFNHTLKLKMNQDEESSFFNFFDQNRDDRVNVAEFIKLMKPTLEKEKSKKSINSLNLSSGSNKNLSENIKTLEGKNEDLEEKLKDYIDRKRMLLTNSFKLKEEIHDEGFVSQEDFIIILREVQPDYPLSDFTRNEIDMIISKFCEKNLDNKINYEKFLNFSPIKMSASRLSRHSNMQGSGSVRDINRSQLIAKDIFGKIANVVKKENIKIIDAFKHFDMNKDGSISAAEFKNAFKRMKFNYTDEDIDQIISLIGDKGKVDYKKFVDALKL
jgi:Ca2+-binding EF-hand superfamily protein